jgi:hypothetical protein
MTARMARPGLNPLVMEDEATWYMEMEKASAIQKPKREGHAHLRSGESNGTGSRSLLEGRPLTPVEKEPGSDCSSIFCRMRLRTILATDSSWVGDGQTGGESAERRRGVHGRHSPGQGQPKTSIGGDGDSDGEVLRGRLFSTNDDYPGERSTTQRG